MSVRGPQAFMALYLATLLLQVAAGLLNSWVALRMVALGNSGLVIGSLMAVNALGLVVGGLSGYWLVARLGHVRAFALCGALAIAASLGHDFSSWLPLWLLLRFLVGLALMTMYIVLESWLNEQAPNGQRGRVLAWYMTASFLGLIGGQLGLSLDGAASRALLDLVVICFALCLVPVSFTQRLPPTSVAPQARLRPLGFVRRIPQALLTILLTGLLSGAFHGLAPVYASQQGLDPGSVGLFMATCLAAGLLAQFPLGLLSDRFPRPRLIRLFALILALSCLPLLWTPVGLPLLLGCGFAIGLVQFSLYPLALGLANDRVESHERVTLAATMLVAFGLGSSIGPLFAGAAMELFGGRALYGFCVLCAVLLGWLVREPRTQSCVETAIP
ncbi:MFS transporter [Pseudomonas fluorescens]|nr:MFS transporter [Pseudomonas fluorescens]